ncbi:Cytochrome c oxidase subunit Vb [Popillia japonica]|uniref:Cytochrome c oxidase subunit Vb n=1 Tax=Popillia japonica TaxID=7064 RepID=A0AAW1KI71_POPJA
MSFHTRINHFSTIIKRNLTKSTRSPYKNSMGDPIEHATGLEKRELLSKLAGNENPFNMKLLKRGPGTKTQPNEIPSAFDQRLVGCVCEEDQMHINWMWLVDGQPRRCECGFWFKLVKSSPL